VSRGTFYHYFDDIDVAIEAVLAAFFRALLLPPTTRRNKESPDERNRRSLYRQPVVLPGL